MSTPPFVETMATGSPSPRSIVTPTYSSLTKSTASLDEDALDFVALEVHPQDVVGVLLGFVSVLGEFDAAGLAAAAHVDLCLDSHRIPDFLGRRDRVLDGVGELSRGRRDSPRRRRPASPGIRAISCHAERGLALL